MGKFYIASRLENADRVKLLRSVLEKGRHQVTYDWTVHGSVQREGHDRIQKVSLAETSGVKEADVVIVLLPGGRGTHCELGMAIAFAKRIVIVGDLDRDFGDGGTTVAFYHHPAVLTIPDVADVEWLAHAILPAFEGEEW